MSRLRRVAAPDSREQPKNNASPGSDSIAAIEDNPEYGKVIWTLFNKNGLGGLISYNTTKKTYYGFLNLDNKGLKDPLVTVKLNKKTMKDQFENTRNQLFKKSNGFLNITDFSPQEIISLDKLMEKKPKRVDEEPVKITNDLPSIEQMVTRYYPDKREPGQQAGHIYGVYVDHDAMMISAFNIDSSSIIYKEPIDMDKAQRSFDQAEQAVIDSMKEDAPYYTRDVENEPASFGINVDMAATPWMKFNEQQQKEKETDLKEKEKIQEQSPEAIQEQQEQSQDQSDKPQESEEPQPQTKKEEPVQEQKPEPEQPKEKPEKKEEKPPKHPQNSKVPTSMRTVEIVFEGKNLPAINKFIGYLEDQNYTSAYDILPVYSFKKAAISINRIITALNLLKFNIRQNNIQRTASLGKVTVAVKKTRLRKTAYVYTQVVNQLVDELINDTHGVDVAAVYFTQNTDQAEDASACGFIVKSGKNYIAFGPGAETDIQTIVIQVNEESDAQKNHDEGVVDTSNEKITFKDFIDRVQNNNLPNIQIFGDVGEAELWIQQANGNNVKGRVVLKHTQEFSNNDMWQNVDEFGDRPDIDPNQVKKPKKDEKPKEKEESDQEKWYAMPDDLKTWKLRMTFKNWTTVTEIIKAWIIDNQEIVLNPKVVGTL